MRTLYSEEKRGQPSESIPCSLLKKKCMSAPFGIIAGPAVNHIYHSYPYVVWVSLPQLYPPSGQLSHFLSYSAIAQEVDKMVDVLFHLSGTFGNCFFGRGPE